MYSRKSVGPTKDPWRTPTFTDILAKTSHPEPSKAACYWEKKQVQISDKKFHWLTLVKKTSIPNSVKSLEISSATAREALAILSEKCVRRSAVDREDLKPYWKSDKRPYFSKWSTIVLYTSFSKTSLTTENRLTEQ